MSENQIALVTGASRGIGLAISRSLAEAGFIVAMCGRDKATIEAAARTLSNEGLPAHGYACDVGSSSEVARLQDLIATELGAISILINNAGIAPSAKLEATTDEMWRETMSVNLDAAFFLSRAVVPGMKKNGGGDIINIASTAALMGFRYNSAYTASKHGLLGLTRALAIELESVNIMVNAICPGFVRTKIVEESVSNIVNRTGMTSADATEVLAKMNREGRLIEPEEIAQTVVHLVTSNDRLTGHAFHADGTLIPENNL